MTGNRLRELLAILLVGDGVMALAAPSRHSRLWQIGPAWMRRMMQPFVDHPGMTRLTAIGQIGTGLWLASRQWPAARK